MKTLSTKSYLIDFKVIQDGRGSLISVEANKNIPFDINRVYYIFDTQPDVIRGKHAHKELKQVIVCTSGNCKILVDDGEEKQIYELNNPSQGLVIEDLVWREMYDFSPGCVLMIIANQVYIESDYIRNYQEFLKFVCT